MHALPQTALFGLVLLLVGSVGCQTAPAGPTAAPPPVPPLLSGRITAVDAAAGRAIYINKCARCHKFYDPARYDAVEWDQWMNKMSRKARLKPNDRELLEKYLSLYRSGLN